MNALNNHNWSDISEKLTTGQIVVIDNFFSEYFLNILFNRMIHEKKFNDDYFDYKANDYTLEDNVTAKIVSELNTCNLFKNKFQRAWSFVYNNEAKGVGLHSDPSNFNINVWVTPDKSMKDTKKNGLIIYKLKPLIGWNREQWNGNQDNCIDNLINFNKPEFLTIPYKCNRAIIFDGMFFHETNDVSVLPGFDNRRVSYTMLFGKT
jgi:hypothetical protein